MAADHPDSGPPATEPRRKRGRRVAVGCAVIAALLLITFLVPVGIGRRQAARVKAAVRASMPEHCSGAKEKLYAHPKTERLPWLGSLVPFPANRWRVGCYTLATCQPLITVDVARCEAHVVTAFSGTYTQTLSPCP